MGIENIKRWHWAIIGLLMGLAFSFSWQGNEPDAERHISQMVFEREALSKTPDQDNGKVKGKPILQNVVVKPAVEDFRKREDKKVQLVTGYRLRHSEKLKTDVPVEFAFIAPVPYQPVIVPNGAKVTPTWTVMDFLAAAQKNDADLHVRFAWEANPRTNMLMWSGAGLVVIGGIWPTILSILTGAGFGRAPQSREDDYDLSRFGKGKQAVPMAKVANAGVVDQDRRRLDALNEALESQLDAAGIVMTTDEPPVSNDDSSVGIPAPVTPLTDAPVEPATVTAQTHDGKHETFEELRKRYAAGDVYPVARGGNKKPGE